jgi:hypothetical protein
MPQRGLPPSAVRLLPILLAAVLGYQTAAAQTSTDSATAHNDSLAVRRDSLMQAVLGRIAGRENEPAGQVFTDIQVLQNMRAGQLLRVMNVGFARSLGVSCEHCHVPGEWGSNEKPAKGVAREMWKMMGVINRDLLPNIPDLRSDNPAVNCTTCHRGTVKPALDLPGAAAVSR